MYPQPSDPLATAIGDMFLARGARVAVAETSAGGLIALRLLSVPGASAWFERGIIAYSRAAKLDVSSDLEAILDTHGAVSPEFVAALAEQLRARTGADYVVTESGIAGPPGARRSPKPIGSAVICIATPTATHIEEHVFPGSRVEVMTEIAQRALEALHKQLVR